MGERDGDRARTLRPADELPEGSDEDGPDAQTVYGICEKKNELVHTLIEREGVRAFPGSVNYLTAVQQSGLRIETNFGETDVRVAPELEIGAFRIVQECLTNVVRHAGASRVCIKMLPDGDHLVIVASKGGAPTNPNWYANVVANPDVTVEVEGRTIKARAVVTKGAERDRLWAGHVRVHPGFAEYETKTSRVIPVVTLAEVR